MGIQATDHQSYQMPAITITIQSWVTPIVGLAMLLIGLLGGYYARPLIDLGSSSSSVTASSVAPGVENPSANQESLMSTVLSQTRHFKGDSQAPVTIIEFSDFQ